MTQKYVPNSFQFGYSPAMTANRRLNFPSLLPRVCKKPNQIRKKTIGYRKGTETTKAKDIGEATPPINGYQDMPWQLPRLYRVSSIVSSDD
jgi:hypothetical protein